VAGCSPWRAFLPTVSGRDHRLRGSRTGGTVSSAQVVTTSCATHRPRRDRGGPSPAPGMGCGCGSRAHLGATRAASAPGCDFDHTPEDVLAMDCHKVPPRPDHRARPRVRRRAPGNGGQLLLHPTAPWRSRRGAAPSGVSPWGRPGRRAAVRGRHPTALKGTPVSRSFVPVVAHRGRVGRPCRHCAGRRAGVARVRPASHRPTSACLGDARCCLTHRPAYVLAGAHLHLSARGAHARGASEGRATAPPTSSPAPISTLSARGAHARGASEGRAHARGAHARGASEGRAHGQGASGQACRRQSDYLAGAQQSHRCNPELPPGGPRLDGYQQVWALRRDGPGHGADIHIPGRAGLAVVLGCRSRVWARANVRKLWPQLACGGRRPGQVLPRGGPY